MNPFFRAMNRNNSSGFPGVTQQTGTTKWKAVINYKGMRYNLGPFHTALEASKARDKKIRALLREELYAA